MISKEGFLEAYKVYIHNLWGWVISATCGDTVSGHIAFNRCETLPVNWELIHATPKSDMGTAL